MSVFEQPGLRVGTETEPGFGAGRSVPFPQVTARTRLPWRTAESGQLGRRPALPAPCAGLLEPWALAAPVRGLRPHDGPWQGTVICSQPAQPRGTVPTDSPHQVTEGGFYRNCPWAEQTPLVEQEKQPAKGTRGRNSMCPGRPGWGPALSRGTVQLHPVLTRLCQGQGPGAEPRPRESGWSRDLPKAARARASQDRPLLPGSSRALKVSSGSLGLTC